MEIAMGLVQAPRLLILDEATEGLAPLVRQEIWAALTTLKAQSGVAILIVDKSVAELAKICDRATILERGATVWSGTMADLSPEISTRYIGV
mgnify:CR=1 FL=1